MEKMEIKFKYRSKPQLKREGRLCRRTRYSLLLLGVILGISLGAEWVANDRPYLLVYRGHFFFPLTKVYLASQMGWRGEMGPASYRVLCEVIGVRCFWPPIRYSPLEMDRDLDRYPSPPSISQGHWMGTDALGRDVLARMIYGFRVSITYAFGVWILAFTLGSLVGAFMGYFGGWIDLGVYRFKEIFFSIPYLVILIALAALISPTLWSLILISSLFGWGPISTYMRSEFLRLRGREFVQAARAIGCTHIRIIFIHIFPNALMTFFSLSPLFLASSILGLSTLDFLGLGVPPPTPSWGEMIRQGKDFVLTDWHLVFFPSVGLFLVLYLITFVGEGLRDFWDPYWK